MEQGQAGPLVLVDDGEGGAGHPALIAQATGQAPGEGGLSQTQAPPVGHHGPGGQDGGQAAAQGLGLRLAVGNVVHGRASFREINSVYHNLNSV